MTRCDPLDPTLFFLALMTTLLSGCMLAPLHEQTKWVTCEHQPGAGLRVVSENGSISVQESDRGDVEIRARIRALTPERLEATMITAEEAEDGSLLVSVLWPEGRRRSREGCSFEVLTPDANGVHLQTSNGGLEAVGLRGKAELRTSNGAIRVEDHDGAVLASTSNGKIGINDVRETVTAHTSNGAVQVRLRPDAQGPVDVKTSNGSIELELGPAFLGSLQLQTSNGSIDVDGMEQAEVVSVSKRQVRLAFHAGEQVSTAKTSNGNIQVRSAPENETSD